MTVTAEVLRQLHRIHQQLNDLRERYERGPKQIRAHEANVQRLENELAKARQEALNARKAADEKQLQLRGKEDKLRNLDGKLSSASTNREYQALKEQIAADKVAASVLEDEILEALGIADEYKNHIAQAEQHLAKGKEEAEKVKDNIERQREALTFDLTRLEGELQKTESQLPADFRQNYERVIRAKGADALAEVEGEHCGGCYQQLTPNMLAQLTMGSSVFCKSCGRLLYMPER